MRVYIYIYIYMYVCMCVGFLGKWEYIYIYICNMIQYMGACRNLSVVSEVLGFGVCRGREKKMGTARNRKGSFALRAQDLIVAFLKNRDPYIYIYIFA